MGTNRLVQCVLMGLGLMACAEEGTLPIISGLDLLDGSLPSCAATSQLGSLRIDTIATGLEIPWDVTFLADGRALVTERAGRIRIITPNGELLPEPWATLDIDAVGEVGLMGIDVSSDSALSSHVFVVAASQNLGDTPASRLLNGVGRRLSRAFNSERGHATTLRIVRFTDRDGSGTDRRVILESLPSGVIHGGGALRFGPDGFLYFTDGDSGEPERAQQPSTVRGKLLRILPDGGIPSENPTAASPVFASGIRHSQGIDWHPVTDELFLIDHGPSGLGTEGGRTGNDELNRVEAGANMGWPVAAGLTRGGGVVSPLAEWDPAIAPAGMTFYRGDILPWRESILVTSLKGMNVRRIELSGDAGSWSAECEEILDVGRLGRLRLISNAPDGSLWVGTSNRDGRGRAGDHDDLIVRLR